MQGVGFRTNVRIRFAPAALAAALTALVATASVQARTDGETKVSCGQKLTRSVKLANDLVDCPGEGLIAGAAGITIDLNGHTIDGTNKDSGIDVSKVANVTVENGTISDFYFSGVNVSDARGTVLRKLTVRTIGPSCKQGDLCAGFFMVNSPGATIVENDVSNEASAFQTNGLDVYTSPGARVERNRVVRNAGEGISVFRSPRSRLVGNVLDANEKEGLHVNTSSDSTLITGNRARGNRTAGIAVGASTDLRVLGNTVSSNGEVGLLLFDLTGGLIRGNRASGNANGIILYAGRSGVARFAGKHGSFRNQLLGNTAIANARVGILVRGDGGKDVVEDSLLSGNAANGNGGDGGIVIEGKATGNTLRGNTAKGNKGHGITAVHGTIDGGGNRASGNKRAPQCVGVKCR